MLFRSIVGHINNVYIVDFYYICFSEQHRVSREKYASKWASYKKRWEDQPLAKEVETAKKHAQQFDTEGNEPVIKYPKIFSCLINSHLKEASKEGNSS